MTTINFAELGGPVFTGRTRGEALRLALKVDQLDSRDESIDVSIPSSNYSITSSFILGLFGDSVVKAGSKDAFYKKYRFDTSSFFKDIVDNSVTQALQGRKNS